MCACPQTRNEITTKGDDGEEEEEEGGEAGAKDPEAARDAQVGAGRVVERAGAAGLGVVEGLGAGSGAGISTGGGWRGPEGRIWSGYSSETEAGMGWGWGWGCGMALGTQAVRGFNSA